MTNRRPMRARATVSRYWRKPALELLAREGEPIEVDLEDVRLIKLLVEQIEQGNTGIVRILKEHARNRGDG